MGATIDYLATLKTQLDAAALAKKAALDIAYERATNVQFDKEGKMSTRKTPEGKDAGPGTLDVQYAEQQRNIGSANEASGMLKSGEYARDLATSQAGYRSTIANLNADRISGQTGIETDSASEYAKYQAMYGKPTPDATPTTNSSVPGSTSTGAGTSAGASTGASTNTNNPTNAPTFPDPRNKQITSNIPSTKKPVVTPKKTLVPVVKKPVGAWDR